MVIYKYSKVGRDSILPEYKPRYPRDPDYRIHHYRLTLWIDVDDKIVEGIATIWLYKSNRDVNTVRFDAVSLEILDVFDSNGPLKYSYDGEVLEVRLRDNLGLDPKPINVRYRVREPEYGLYFIEKPSPMVWSQGETEWHRYWMPIYDYPNMKFTTEVIIHVPRGYKAYSNGFLVEHSEGDKWSVWRYMFDKPHSSYLIAIAVGKFKVKSEVVDGVRLEYIVPEGYEHLIDTTFKNTPDVLRFFNEWLGVKYPYGVYRQVAVSRFIVGGMENTTMTILTDRALLDDHARLDMESEGLISHEFAHQWFGDLVTCRDWSHIWINESFATFLSFLYDRHWKGRDRFIYSLLNALDSYLHEYKNYYSRPIVFRLYKYPEELFDAHSYPKGALVLNMLMNILGEDVFRRAIKEFLVKYRYLNADTEDFRRVVEDVSGYNLEWFFEQYIYNSGHPVIKIKYEYDSGESLLTIKLSQEQGDDSLEVYTIPLDIIIELDGGEKISRRIVMRDKSMNIYFDVKDRPKAVYIDPEFKVFAVLEPEYRVEDLIWILRNSEYVYWRLLAARCLGKEKSSRVVDALAEAVEKDEFYGVSIEAAKSLGRIKTPYSKEKLLGLIDKVGEPRVRREVIRSLSNYKGDDIGSKLEKIIGDRSEAYTVRAAAGYTIGKTKYSRALDVLLKYIDEESIDYVITKGVLQGLAEYGGKRALEKIFEYTSIDKQETVRAMAVSLLGKFPEYSEVYKYLEEFAYDPEIRVRRAVVMACRELMDERCLKILSILESREKLGWTWKAAKLTSKKIRENIEKGVEWKRLREEMSKIMEESRRIWERVERLEGKI